METRELTGGEAIVQGLLAHDIDTVFALPGAQIYGLIDAFAKNGDRIRTIGARHEQTCGYMAFGYARASGRPGVFAVVPGPGILNASAALLTANSCNARVLALTGDMPSGAKGRERGALHELRDQLGILRSLTKWADHIEHPSQASLLVARAFQEMSSGRQGATALQAAWDYFTATAGVGPAVTLPLFPSPELDLDAIDEAAKLIQASTAPLLVVGSGALHASAEVTALAEMIGAPAVSFRGGRGVVSDDHPLGLTIAAAQRLWPKTDVAIVIGTRFELLDIRWRHRPPGLKIIRIDIDPAELRRLPAAVGIVADAAAGANALARALTRRGTPKRRDDQIATAKEEAAIAIRSVQPQVDYLGVIRDVLPRDGFFVEEISQMGFSAMFGFPVYEPRTFVTSGYQGTLGFGFPTALGAKVAFPQRPVVSVTGDGGFMFAAQELATAVQYGINLVTLVFNNESYGNVYRDQKQQFAGRLLGSELVNPNFVALAESFGVSASSVSSPQALRPALERAFGADRPVLIEVKVPRGSDGDPWKFILPTFS
ncbi:MAG TPA: thiamine pyrophosphate-dependent enzyme [Steroidobacteraceae bacterium]|nr:thiamine pyrophosphate-dependent enzyme [Steroidobacteraceae bacterium]